MVQRIGFTSEADSAGLRLDQCLFLELPKHYGKPLSKSKIRKLIVAGAVYLNKKRTRIASKPIAAQVQIEVYLDAKKLQDQTSNDQPFELGPENILFEDDVLIVVNKPAGLPTQPTLDEARWNLFNSVKKYLVQKSGDPAAYLGMHHRLDRDTSGVVLFTKSKLVNRQISDAFQKHELTKIYQAICEKPATFTLNQPQWVVRNYLGRKTGGTGKQTRYGAVRAGGSFAETEFKLKEEFKNALLVEANPKTGRTHQIRVHLSEAGTPILLDSLYGRPDALPESGRMMLHAYSLTLRHPITQNEMTVVSPLPQDFLECLERLQKI